MVLGERQSIIDRKMFDAVQELLSSKSTDRKARRTASEAQLMATLSIERFFLHYRHIQMSQRR